ncbi:MAG: diguanylate cyclase [Candidatus Woesearchaeota archaeon]
MTLTPNPDDPNIVPAPRRQTLVFQATNGGLIVRPQLGIADKSAYRIVVLDPNQKDNERITTSLQKEGYVRTYPASSIPELEDILQKTEPQLILTELDLGSGDFHEGLELMHRIDEERRFAVNYMVITSCPNQDLILDALRNHAMDFMQKPVDCKYLTAKVEKALIDLEMRRMALTDPMTRLANKGTLYDYMHGQLATLTRSYKKGENRHLSLAIMDIDDFKAWNTAYGHLQGDYLLTESSNYFSTRLRGADLMARYGGEEFVIIMPETDFNQTFRAYHRLMIAFKTWQREKPDKFKRFVTFSAGVSTLDLETYTRIYRGQGVDLSNPLAARALTNIMIGCADEGLAKVKVSGKDNCYPDNCLLEFYDKVVKADPQ